MEVEQTMRLRDILDAVTRIDSYVAGISQEEFFRNAEKQDAVIRRIEIIGEATAHLHPETRSVLSELPYRKMRGSFSLFLSLPPFAIPSKEGINTIMHTDPYFLRPSSFCLFLPR